MKILKAVLIVFFVTPALVCASPKTERNSIKVLHKGLTASSTIGEIVFEISETNQIIGATLVYNILGKKQTTALPDSLASDLRLFLSNADSEWVIPEIKTVPSLVRYQQSQLLQEEVSPTQIAYLIKGKIVGETYLEVDGSKVTLKSKFETYKYEPNMRSAQASSHVVEPRQIVFFVENSDRKIVLPKPILEFVKEGDDKIIDPMKAQMVFKPFLDITTAKIRVSVITNIPNIPKGKSLIWMDGDFTWLQANWTSEISDLATQGVRWALVDSRALTVPFPGPYSPIQGIVHFRTELDQVLANLPGGLIEISKRDYTSISGMPASKRKEILESRVTLAAKAFIADTVSCGKTFE